VALKIITLEEGESFDDLAIEIDVLKTSSNENIVKYYGSWKKENELFVSFTNCMPILALMCVVDRNGTVRRRKHC
jgi:hypothetical protein